MKKVFDYLLIRTPEPRMAGPRGQPGEVSPSRLGFSFLGLFLGIVASFYVTGLEPSTPGENRAATEYAAVEAAGPTPGVSATGKTPPQPRVVSDFSWQRMKTVGLISLVICGLTFQGLYFSLRLYQNEPPWLILFISFQYGYFWQSLVEGARILLS